MNIQEGINQLLGYAAAGTGFIKHSAQQKLETEKRNTDENVAVVNERAGRYNEGIGKSPRYKSLLNPGINQEAISKYRDMNYNTSDLIGLRSAIKQEKRFQQNAISQYEKVNPANAVADKKALTKLQRAQAMERRMTDSVQTEFDTQVGKKQNFDDLKWRAKGGEWLNG